ncbi:MAG: cellulase family glycosylhydrolase [Sporocytophaga sp.]|uniref:Ig-like domain-containing protein n=1 Tax=Sporocytophaga sp. TaxID=2231183 RepID=UPI001B1F7DE0|nr:Ig-like domain-containing protein [Sporocytophaga sp.]MBO9703726.1 cellulase family glycosylhydrolase [Sporocytophaga sp.]
MKHFSFIRNIAFLILFFCWQSSFAQYPAGSPVAMNGKLKVVGSQLTSECGNPVQLKGFSSHGLQWFSNCVKTSALDELVNNWGIDIFRLAMYVQEQGYVTNPTTWKTYIDTWVDECGKRGIYCMIDWHVLNPGDPNANLTESKDFWTYMATKHGGKKHVLFEICNEPNGVNWSTVKTYANAVIPVIRAIDPNTIIIVGTPNWSQDVDIAANDPLNYDNLMYTLHFYSGTHAATLRQKGDAAIAKGKALFVTECGTSDASGNGGPYLSEFDNWISWMNSKKISWINWSYSDKAETSAALTSGSCNSGSWNNLTQSGTYIKGKVSVADNFISCIANASPTVSITSPANNATYAAGANITLTANASDTDGQITKVEFYNGTTLLGSSTTSPYSYTWTGVAAGTFTITAKATDNGGAATTSTAITIVVNANKAPTVSITAPANSATFAAGASITLTASASDADGQISKVEFYNGTTLLGSSTTSPYTYTWTGVAAGTYTITAKATDNGGSSTVSTAITVVVNANKVPTVSITAPLNNATFEGGANITLTASAADADGTVSKVEFYNGTTLLGSATTSPYTYIWSGVAAGTYTITAKATDDKGGIGTSTAIKITVTVPQTPYGGKVWPISGRIEAENYDLGGSGLAYSDSDAGNTGSAFRTDDVDIEASIDVGGGYNVGWTVTGEWLEYSVNVAETGKYDFKVRVAAASTGKTMHIEMNGINVTGAISVPNTGDFQAWQTVTIPAISLTAGNQIMRVVFDSDEINLNYVDVTAVNKAPTVSITAPANNASYVAAASFTITANATDSDGNIAKVEFYNGTALIGSDATAPFSYDWNNVAAGTYTITAKATDNNGASTVSTAITVVVNPNKLPAVSLTAPANNTVLQAPASNVLLTALASDTDGSVVKVEFYNGTTLLGSDDTSPYNFTIASLPAGTYTLTAKAMDDKGGVSTSSSVTLVVNQAPTVLITSPLNNASFVALANITITADASDAEGVVSKVEFYNGATFLGSDLTAPYSYSWNGVAAGTYNITARATDNYGAVVTSSVVKITVNSNKLPSISITAPVNNTVLQSPATNVILSADATDSDGAITKVEFYNGNTLLGTDTSAPYSFTWASVTAGKYTITAQATDDKGGVTISSSVLLIVNQAPSVSIISPSNNASFVAPASVVINGDATDADGSITKVEFYSGSTLIGTDLTAPYAYTLSDLPVGTYSVTIKATDNNGATTTSAAVSFKVNENQPSVIQVKSPTDNSTVKVGASVNFDISVSDPDGGIAKVEYYDGTTLIGTSSTAPFNINWTVSGTGSHNITIKVTDSNGGVTISSPLALTAVANQSPTVKITSPKNNAILLSSESIILTADASDADGNVSKVEFYSGSMLLGSAVNAPYEFTWLNPGDGIYTIIAVAVDDNGAKMPSVPVTINVAPVISGVYSGTSSSQLKLYPNPSNTDFRFVVNEDIESYSVVNLLGETLSSEGRVSNGQEITLGEDLEQGAYILKVIYTSGKKEAIRMIKIK